MNEVSCRAVGMFVDGLRNRGIPEPRLVEGMGVTLDDLTGFRKRIDWDLFVQLCERLEVLCGGPAGLFEFGHDQFQGSANFSFMRQVARVFRRPRDLYWMGTVWFGRTLFSVLEDEFKDLPDERIREVIRIPASYRDCPQLFHIMHGVLTAAPRLLRYPDSQVEMDLGPRQATYLITPPARNQFPRRGIAKLTSRFAAWDLIDSLSKQQGELRESVQELSAAREEVIEQLELVQRLGHELSRQVELDELPRALVQLFEKHLPGWKLAFWLQPLDGSAATLLTRTTGASGPPTHCHTLQTGSGIVGRLEVWSEGSSADPGRGDLVARLVPWISLALDNARSRAALRSAARARSVGSATSESARATRGEV